MFLSELGVCRVYCCCAKNVH